MRKLFAAVLLAGTTCSFAAPQPYDESADARAQIRSALVESQRKGLPVLVVFGANWCGDCKVLDMTMKSGSSATLVKDNFVVVKVDVGRIDRNTDIAIAYGVPLRDGIPAAAVLSPSGQAVYATRPGELSAAGSMGEKRIQRLLAKMATRGRCPHWWDLFC